MAFDKGGCERAMNEALKGYPSYSGELKAGVSFFDGSIWVVVQINHPDQPSRSLVIHTTTDKAAGLPSQIGSSISRTLAIVEGESA